MIIVLRFDNLIETLLQKAVTICPDLLSDSYRQVSYLGISVRFTDEKYQFLTYDLCCYPYTENDKSAANIILVSSKISEIYTCIFRIMTLARRGGGELGADGARRGQVEDFNTRQGGGEMNFWLPRGSLIHIQ